MKAKFQSLSMKISLLIVSLMIILLTFSVVLFMEMIKLSVENTISSYSVDTAKNIVKHIDAVEYQKFLEEKSENDTYWDLRNELNDLREKTGALYVYTVEVDEQEKQPKVLIDGQPEGSNVASELGEPTSTTTYDDVFPVLKGGTNSTKIVHDPEYGDYLSAFAPIKYNGEVIGILGVDIDAKEVGSIQQKVIKEQLMKFILLFVIGIGLISGISFFYIRKRLKALEELNEVAEKIAAGELNEARNLLGKMRIKGKDEIASLSQSFEQMMTGMREMVTDITESAYEMLETFKALSQNIESAKYSNEQITMAIRTVSSSAQQQETSMSETADAVEEMAIGVQKIAESSSLIAESSNDVMKQVERGNGEIEKAIKQIDNMRQAVIQTSIKIKELGSRVGEVEQILTAITEISEQTNLLALNANIEAARAGEHGKGFAVVANEVRKLAEQAKHSAQKIAALIQQFQIMTNEAVHEMESGTQEVEKGTKAVHKVGEVFQSIFHAVHQSNNEIQEVSAITEEMSAGSEQISASVEQSAFLTKEATSNAMKVAESVEKQMKTMEEIAASTELLGKISEKLEQAVRKFHL
ncbi:methyl-accepting chemotaxis protein [Anoxybacillus calidus]|jgi:methyl-accepting chemotaxis protein|uniref:Methyl-accepting chemotaxis protein n=1 Tax=[Anoxybacillus] calidus TaxID=575178 RepID=A0A7W0BVH6_9BACL|nr:methyl-accepting chemotaxis protein [Anoxybacillus calidus]MBA2872406.1 methyl-accepting chemotaxis protein [Anoxybacillus calidus]